MKPKLHSLADEMARCGGRAPGFDALRLMLSVAVLVWHSFYVTVVRDSALFTAVWTHPVVMPVLRAILPMFFFLGGFLVAGSAFRLRNTYNFLLFRFFRIVPALLVEVAFSALLLGALLTTLPLTDYFSHPQFWRYFLNVVGLVQFQLPGVLKANPNDIVNINLWTLPPDFHSYGILAVLMVSGFLFNTKNFFRVFVAGSAMFFALLLYRYNWGDSGRMFVAPVFLIYAFMLGVFCFVFSHRIPFNKWLGLLSLLGICLLANKYTLIPGVVAACYLTLVIGFMDLSKFPLVRHGDYSYGIYLYGFPIQQAMWHYLPSAREWWFNFLLALPATLLFSVLSWHMIEKPFLALRHRFELRRPASKLPAASEGVAN
jgi:peptidoglycan/LPS O-acetylase OafA/YrhL